MRPHGVSTPPLFQSMQVNTSIWLKEAVLMAVRHSGSYLPMYLEARPTQRQLLCHRGKRGPGRMPEHNVELHGFVISL